MRKRRKRPPRSSSSWTRFSATASWCRNWREGAGISEKKKPRRHGAQFSRIPKHGERHLGASSTSAQGAQLGSSMENYWCAARLMATPRGLRDPLPGARRIHDLSPPAAREPHHARSQGRSEPPLFPGYIFIAIVLQWHAARWGPGVAHIIMDGMTPARVPDHIIDEIRSRERGGLATQAARLAPGRQGPDHLGTVRASSRALCRPDISGSRRGCSCSSWAAGNAPSFPPTPWRRCTHDPPSAGRDRLLLC